jgi:hypothetical protein
MEGPVVEEKAERDRGVTLHDTQDREFSSKDTYATCVGIYETTTDPEH